MADPTVIAIVAGATTTISVPLIGVWADARRARHSRALSDMSELRALLDDVAVALDEARVVVDQLQDLFLRLDLGEMEEVRRAYETRQHTLRRLRARVAIRLGTKDPATKALDAAVGILDGIGTAALMPLMFRSAVVSRSRQQQAGRILELWPQYEPAVNAYTEAARRAVGVQLPAAR